MSKFFVCSLLICYRAVENNNSGCMMTFLDKCPALEEIKKPC